MLQIIFLLSSYFYRIFRRIFTDILFKKVKESNEKVMSRAAKVTTCLFDSNVLIMNYFLNTVMNKREFLF